MRTLRRRLRGWAIAAAAAGLCGPGVTGSGARAAVVSATGQVRASVSQSNAATGQTIDEAFQESPGTTDVLPATASAALDIATPTGIEGSLDAVSAVNVPGDKAPADTNDFSMEACGLSLLSGRSFNSTATATQNRLVALSADEIGLAADTRVLVRSDFVVACGVFLITIPGGPSDATGRIHFTITQQDDDGSREVLSGALDVFFDSSGRLRTTGSDGLEGVLPVIADLSGKSENVQQAQLVLLPAVTVPYEYEAVINRPFTLSAQVDVTVEAPSGDEGGSAFVGRLPHLLADSASRFLQVDFTDDLDVLTRATAQSAAGTPAGMEITPIAGNFANCGQFGLETLLGGLLLSAAFVTRRFA